jgi:hypothetical protein
VRKIWAVVRREFLERVRTKWFIISTVLGPVFMIGITVLPALLASSGGGPRAIAVVDEGSGTFASRLVTQLGTGNRFNATRVSAEGPRASEVLDSLTRTVQAKTLDGFLIVGPSAVESGIVEYRGRNVSSLRDMALLEGVLRQVVVVERLTRRVGQDVVLHTIHYVEGDPSHGVQTPRLVGFLSETDRDFFRVFTTVKGIGMRKALRALARPVAEIAAAIQNKDRFPAFVSLRQDSVPALAQPVTLAVTADTDGYKRTRLRIGVYGRAQNPIT